MKNIIHDIKAKKSTGELLRYGLIGVSSNLVIYLAYLIATCSGATPKITMSILYALSVLFGFILNLKWTFSHNGKVLDAGVRYLFTHCLGYLTNLIILYVLVDNFGFPHQWVQAFAIVFIAMALFLLCKFFVFSDSTSNIRKEL